MRRRSSTASQVADIQTASGLTAGSGALYKHFTSKQALLEAGVRRYVADLEQRRAGFVQALPDDRAGPAAVRCGRDRRRGG